MMLPGSTARHEIEITRVVKSLERGAIVIGRVCNDDDPLYDRKIKVVLRHRGFQPVLGDVWRVEGMWQDHPEYGRQVQAGVAVRSVASKKLLVRWLIERVDGIGETRARRIIEEVGHDRLCALLEGEPLEAISMLAPVIAPTYPALSTRLAATLVTKWRAEAAEPRLVAWLEERGVQKWPIVTWLLDVLGEHAVQTLEENPYIISPILAWKHVDTLGLRTLREQGVLSPQTDARRLLGAVDDVVRREIGDGHTLVDPESMQRGLMNNLGNQDLVSEAVRLGVLNERILPCDGGWRAPGCAAMEDDLIALFSVMASSQDPNGVNASPEVVETALKRLEDNNEFQLHPEQAAAVQAIFRTAVAVLTGGAGVGKTYTTQAICAVWEALGGRVQLCALSGKAALRLAQATQRSSRTIFRMLNELEKRDAVAENSDTSCSDMALVDNKTLLLVDEASMVDLGQWWKIGQRLVPGARLLCVGDPAQLPPIGMGCVFHHLAADDAITTRLTTVHRQRGTTGIPAISQTIRDRRLPNFIDYIGISEGVSFVHCSTDDIPKMVEQIVRDLGGFRGDHALQIITARAESHPCSVEELNRCFHRIHMRFGYAEAVGPFNRVFAPHEPIIHLRNDYKNGLFNGLLGRTVDVKENEQHVITVFDENMENMQAFDYKRLIDIDLAYAVTAHKAQGSQTNRIIIPVYDTQLLDPSWLYTAVTRAEEQAVIVGDIRALKVALKREFRWVTRRVGWSKAESLTD